MFRLVIISLFLAVSLCSCNVVDKPGPSIEYYYASNRKFAPEPVYNRLTWSHLPEPMPARGALKAPYLSPTVSFELPNSNLEEALTALAQTIGYEPIYPEKLAKRGVSIEAVATIDEILAEIGEQAGVMAEINHERRFVRVTEKPTTPKLPE